MPARQQTVVHRQYRQVLARGRLAHPPPEASHRPGQCGRLAQSPARTLLAFLDDLTNPFDNTQAERGLRGFKVQQKISGCFRSDHGAVAYARISAYLATLRKQGRALLTAPEIVFTGQPIAPEFA